MPDPRAHTSGMDHLPSARMVPHEPFARARATVARARRTLARTWARIAQQVLVMSLTAVGFAAILALTFVLAQHAITMRAVEADTVGPRPMVIYFMRAPQPRTVHAALATMSATEREVGAIPAAAGAGDGSGADDDVAVCPR